MKKMFTFSFFIFMIIAVSAQKSKSKIQCDYTLQEGFKKAIVEPSFESISGNDTIRINELKLTCVIAGRKSQIALYDAFGKWSSFVRTNDEIPLLVWKNIKLFKSKDKKYTVVAHGVQYLYTSFLVFDEQNNDMLSDNSLEKEELVKYFKKLIKKPTSKESNFCVEYNEEFPMDEPLSTE